MEKIVVTGGQKLKGTVYISGSKNASLPILAATLLSCGENHITNIPDLDDIHTMKALLESLGANVLWKDGELTVDTSTVNEWEAPYELVRKMRASVLVMGALIARFGRAKIPLPGGCAIGLRPINLHLMGLERLGCKVSIESGFVSLVAKKLIGTEIYLDFPSVGATENLILASLQAEGETIIDNAANEPEIEDLAQFLNQSGADISGIGTGKLIIKGRNHLSPPTAPFKIIPDRIEAGTYLVATAITGGDTELINVCTEHLYPIMSKLVEAGCTIEHTDERIHLKIDEPLSKVLPFSPLTIKTAPYPGFPTDMQPQMMSLMTIISGTSMITETVFESRFTHIPELMRMGAKIEVEGHTAIITGVNQLFGAEVVASDLRAGASLVIAGLSAEGQTYISGIEHITRGYDRLEEKLLNLNAIIQKEETHDA